MKQKNTRKPKDVKYLLEEIDELKMIIIVAVPQSVEMIVDKINSLGGRVLMTESGEGISSNKPMELLGVQTTENVVIFATARKEDALNIMVAVDTEYNFTLPGNGIGMVIDVIGYMGAKGLFLN